MQDLDHLPIENLKLSRRVLNVLRRSRAFTIADLRRFSATRNFIQIRGVGQKAWADIQIALDEFSAMPFPQSQPEQAQLPFLYQENKATEIDLRFFSVDLLQLSPMLRARLKEYSMNTIADLMQAHDTVLLNINQIGPKTLADIRHQINEIATNPSKYRVAAPEPQTLERINTNWADVAESYFRTEKSVYNYILISRFGYTPKTLEEIAIELGITRERVRQIQEAVAVRYLKHIRFSGGARFLERVEEIFSVHGDDLSLPGLKAILKKEGMLGQFSEPLKTEHIKNLDLLETLICWLTLISNKKYILQPIEFSINVPSLKKSGKISIKEHAIVMNISKKEKRKIKRKVLFTGGITIKEVAKILSKDERIIILALKNMNLQKIDNEWLSFKSLAEDKDNSKIPLRIAGLKMLAVNPMMDINSFHDGLRRHASRFYTSIAPLHVIKHILPMLGFEINDSKISTQLSTNGILSQSEKSLVSAISKNEGIASFIEIAEEFFLQNLSLPAVSVTLKRSAIAEKADDGLYKLRGTNISWRQIDYAKKRQKRFSQDNEVTHGLDGVVRMKFTVSSYAFLTGVVGAYSIKELPGSWSVIHDGKAFGEAKIDEVYLWGLAKLFKEMDVKMGDRIELGFNTWKRTISFEKVSYGSS